MEASKDRGAFAVGDDGRGGVQKDLDDSWFRWQKPPTVPPPRSAPPPRPRQESLDDEIADAWFV